MTQFNWLDFPAEPPGFERRPNHPARVVPMPCERCSKPGRMTYYWTQENNEWIEEPDTPLCYDCWLELVSEHPDDDDAPERD